METKIKKRIAGLDLMKFIAMFCVVLYHGRYLYFNILEDNSILELSKFYIHNFLCVGVPLFFFVNGFLLINKKLNLKKHILKTVRLIAITFIWGAISLLCLSLLRGDKLTLMGFLGDLWNWKQGYINHLWFMGALVSIYFVFPLIKAAFDNNKKIFNYFFVFTFIVAFLSNLLCAAATISDYFILDSRQIVMRNWLNMFNPFKGVRAHTLAFFMLGAFFGANKNKIDEKIKKFKFINNWTLILTVLVSTFLYSVWAYFTSSMMDKQWDTVWYGYSQVTTLINVICLYLLCRSYRENKRNILKNAVSLVSRNTLGIYFLHVFFIEIMRKIGFTSMPFAQNYLVLSSYVLFIVFACAGVSEFLKRVPVIKKLF